MNKDLKKFLAGLERRGYEVDEHRRTIIAPDGERHAMAGDLRHLRHWATKKDKAADDSRDRDLGGVVMNRFKAERTVKRVDGVLRHWDALSTEQRLQTVKEMLHRLGSAGLSSAFDALHRLEQG